MPLPTGVGAEGMGRKAVAEHGLPGDSQRMRSPDRPIDAPPGPGLRSRACARRSWEAGSSALSCAFALVEDGHEVVVLERGRAGGGASAGNAGWVTPSLVDAARRARDPASGLRHALDPNGALVIRPRLDPAWIRWLVRFARASRRDAFGRGVEALLRLTRVTLDELDRMSAAGVVFEQHAAGLLAVAREPSALHWFEDVFAELDRLGFEGGLERIAPDEARALEPALSAAVGAALHATVDRHVEPSSLTAGLASHLASRGVDVREGTVVTSLQRDVGGWRVVTEGGADARVDEVVLAAAMGSSALVRPLGLRLPLAAAKGYSVTLPHADPTPGMPAVPLRAEARPDPVRRRAADRGVPRDRCP